MWNASNCTYLQYLTKAELKIAAFSLLLAHCCTLGCVSLLPCLRRRRRRNWRFPRCGSCLILGTGHATVGVRIGCGTHASVRKLAPAAIGCAAAVSTATSAGACPRCLCNCLSSCSGALIWMHPKNGSDPHNCVTDCRFSHPPFDLPSGPAPSSPIARPSSDAEQLNPLAQPLPPVPPPPSAITAPGPRDGRAKAVAVTALASNVPTTGSQQNVPTATKPSPAQAQAVAAWEQQQAQQGAPASALHQPPPPPKAPLVAPDAVPKAQQGQTPAPPPPPQRVTEPPTQSATAHWVYANPQQQQQQERAATSPAFAFWGQTQNTGPKHGGLARSSSASEAATHQAISNADPVVSWYPSGTAGLAADSKAPAVAAPAPTERPSQGPPTRDQIVGPPKRTASLSRLPPAAGGPADAAAVPGWAQMGGWGRSDGGLSDMAAAPVSTAPASSAAAEAFNPFGDNPLHRALAADYRRDPVVAQPARKTTGAAPALRPKAPGNPVARDVASLASILPHPGTRLSTETSLLGGLEVKSWCVQEFAEDVLLNLIALVLHGIDIRGAFMQPLTCSGLRVRATSWAPSSTPSSSLSACSCGLPRLQPPSRSPCPISNSSPTLACSTSSGSRVRRSSGQFSREPCEASLHRHPVPVSRWRPGCIRSS